ncbi:MAG: hypothetical protein ACR2QF_00440 [Geminicoccaceae bacterium]
MMKDLSNVELAMMFEYERRKIPTAAGLAAVAGMFGGMETLLSVKAEQTKPKSIDKNKVKRRAKEKAARKQRKINRRKRG